MKNRNPNPSQSAGSNVTLSLRLVSTSEPVPLDIEAVLRELGAGDSRFWGTPFGRGECSLQEFLQTCRESEAGLNLTPDLVPQSTFWVVDESERVIGIVRVRHRLNERLLQYGGHIGYYIRESARGKGYGKVALSLALERLRRLSVSRALLTINPANARSLRVVLANGGVRDSDGIDPVSKEIVNRYWIEL